MKTKKFKYKPDYSFLLIGINSIEDDYKICWIINKISGVDLIKQDSLEIRNNKFYQIQSFSVFKGETDFADSYIKLVSNKCTEGFLIEELKNIDYFIVISDEKVISNQQNFIKDLKQNSEITSAFIINPEDLKSKEKLLF